MPDNSKLLQDRGWEQMQALLDREMPVRRRRRAFWWWVSAGYLALFLLATGERKAPAAPEPDTPTAFSPPADQPAGIRKEQPELAVLPARREVQVAGPHQPDAAAETEVGEAARPVWKDQSQSPQPAPSARRVTDLPVLPPGRGALLTVPEREFELSGTQVLDRSKPAGDWQAVVSLFPQEGAAALGWGLDLRRRLPLGGRWSGIAGVHFRHLSGAWEPSSRNENLAAQEDNSRDMGNTPQFGIGVPAPVRPEAVVSYLGLSAGGRYRLRAHQLEMGFMADYLLRASMSGNADSQAAFFADHAIPLPADPADGRSLLHDLQARAYLGYGWSPNPNLEVGLQWNLALTPRSKLNDLTWKEPRIGLRVGYGW